MILSTRRRNNGCGAMPRPQLTRGWTTNTRPVWPAKRAFVRFCVPVCLASILGLGHLDTKRSRIRAALTSTEAWLSLIDHESYAASWDAAASLIRTRVLREQWQTAVRAVPAPFGQLKARRL